MADGKNKSFLFNIAKKFFNKEEVEEDSEEIVEKEETSTDLSDMPQLMTFDSGDSGEDGNSNGTISDEEAMKQLKKMMYGVDDAPVDDDFNKAKEEETLKTAIDESGMEPIDSQATVEISSDGMKANLFITKPIAGGKELTLEEVNKIIADNKIAYGLKPLIVKDMVQNKIYGKNVKIAQGLFPIPGKDGYIEEITKLNETEKGPKERSDGTVDYKELGNIVNVEKGQILCKIHYPIPGVNGKNILGVDLAYTPGREPRDPMGRNTVYSNDKKMLISSIAGCLNIIDGKYSISEVYKINGNVDSSTGNINFLGSVIVGGDVKEGFSITATDSVNIAGVVEGAYIKSGGDVKIKQGINGMGKGTIIAKGNVQCRFIENCRIQAFGDVVAESIVGANISCDNDLIVTGGKGVIMGGDYIVAGDIVSRTIGSVSNMTTNIVLGVAVTLSEQISNLKKEEANILQEINKLNQVATYFAELAKKQQLDQEKVAFYNSAVYTHNEKVKQLQRKREEISHAETKLNESIQSTISAKDKIYPGVNITIGNLNTRIKNEVERPLVYFGQQGGIIISEGGAK